MDNTALLGVSNVLQLLLTSAFTLLWGLRLRAAPRPAPAQCSLPRSDHLLSSHYVYPESGVAVFTAPSGRAQESISPACLESM